MQITFVLGIHRSGTSLLAAGIEALGADLGQFHDPRGDDNPKGYFEHAEIRGFNDRLLVHLGASWDNWGLHLPSQADGLPDLTGWETEAAQLLARLFPGPVPAVVKDPRITTLMPFWSRVVDRLGWTPRHVVAVRPPAEVAESQRRRAARRPDAFPLIADAEPMCALWAVHSHAMLLGLPEADTLLVRHDALYGATGAVLDKIAAHLALTPDPARRQAYLDDHLDPELYQARPPERPCAPGSWCATARDFHKALAPTGWTGVLTGQQARLLAARQSAILQRLPTLDAVRQSLGAAVNTLRAESEKRSPVVQARNAALWGLSQALISSDADGLPKLRAQLDAPETAVLSDLAVMVVRARLATALGDIDGARAVYDAMRARHPGNGTVAQITQRFEADHPPAPEPAHDGDG